MQESATSKANRIMASIMAFVFAFSLLGVPSFAFADEEQSQNEKLGSPSIAGVDFMQPTATGWELFKAENLGTDPVYITVTKKDASGTTKLAERSPYTVDADQATDGTGAQIAQIVALQLKADADAEGNQSPQQLLSDPNNHPEFIVEVFDAKLQGNQLYKGTVYPVYASLVDKDGNAKGTALLGIRTANDTEKNAPRNLGVGATFYDGTHADGAPVAYELIKNNGIDNKFDGDKYVVTYRETAADSIVGTITYVDDTTGEVVKVETIPGITEGNGKEAVIKKSFTAEVEENGTAVTKYFRSISSLSGAPVVLDVANANHVVRVIPRQRDG